jgi:hypothetical protein
MSTSVDSAAAKYRAAVWLDKGAAERPDRAPLNKVAVLVAHGMGQQIAFETLALIAEGLQEAAKERGDAVDTPLSRSFTSNGQPFQRIELRVRPHDAAPVDVHVYEGYWAPLTEGKVNLRDVIDFLRGAAKNGILNSARGTFRRWMFDRFEPFHVPARTMLYLILALAVVLSLVVMNSAIAAVAAARALLSATPSWLSAGLLSDLTTTFNVVLAALAIFGVSLAIAWMLPTRARFRRRVAGVVTIGTSLLALVAIVLAGVSLPFLFYGHVRGGIGADVQLWHRLFAPSLVAGFDSAFGVTLAWLTILALAVAAARWTYTLGHGVLGDFETRDSRFRTTLVTAGFLVVAAAAVVIAVKLSGATASLGAIAGLSASLPWLLLIAASAFIRQVLVQFVGDVAAYVSPYKLDRFNSLRKDIKDAVYKVARGIYEMRDASKSQRPDDKQAPFEYQQVVIAGHSLGSVVAYDILNQLIREDEKSELNIATRTPLLLTFGSPLDKTAFIFGVQGNGTTEARESVAASYQPLLLDYAYRPAKWVNVYSLWDIISSRLKLYDLPDATDPKRVDNVLDTDASTLLLAHTEYWKTGVVFDRMYDAVIGTAGVPRLDPSGVTERV